MRFLVLVSCALAVASAGWAPVEVKYHGPQHIPVIHNGVPVDTKEVQHARTAHLLALAEASAHPGYEYDDGSHESSNNDHDNNYKYTIQHDTHYEHDDGSYHHDDGSYHNDDGSYHNDEHENNYKYSIHHVAPVHSKHFVPAYETSHVIPAISHDGKPLDTPEVEEAKAHHFALVHKALSHHRRRREIFEVPEETHEVKQARAEHQVAYEAASKHVGTFGYSVHQKHTHDYKNHYTHEIPAIGHDGKPLDTHEVELAKAAHFAAHHEAAARAHQPAYGYSNEFVHVHQSPIEIAHHY